ncbi:MAG: L-rhamnose mutarotase [Balneolales bacterium]
MKLKPGNIGEYRERHDQIWPDLKAALKEAGVYDYRICYDGDTHTLWAMHKLKQDHTSDRLPDLPVMKKWWDHMKDIMEVNPDNSPVVTPLETVFYME